MADPNHQSDRVHPACVLTADRIAATDCDPTTRVIYQIADPSSSLADPRTSNRYCRLLL
jgi:hypothetical protein